MKIDSNWFSLGFVTWKSISSQEAPTINNLTRKTKSSFSWVNPSSIIVSFLPSEKLIFIETYERKGKLQKKGLNSDKFKERQFVLDKDQLFYYKNEKLSKDIPAFYLFDRGKEL
jgi:hypothetical protein